MYGSIRPLGIIKNAIESLEKKHAEELKALKEEHDAAIFKAMANKAFALAGKLGFKFDAQKLEWVNESTTGAESTTKLDYVNNSRRPIMKGDMVTVKGYPGEFQVESVLSNLNIVRVRPAGKRPTSTFSVNPIALSLIY